MLKRALFALIITFLADFSGCTLEAAPNYDSSKSIPCTTDCLGEQTGSNCCCEEIIYGCMDENAHIQLFKYPIRILRVDMKV